MDPIGAGTPGGTDLFMYVELDESDAAAESQAASQAVQRVGPRMNDDWDPLNPRNCSYAELEPALALLQPLVFRLHDEATAPPFPASNCTMRAVPQLEKVAACFRLARAAQSAASEDFPHRIPRPRRSKWVESVDFRCLAHDRAQSGVTVALPRSIGRISRNMTTSCVGSSTP